MAIPKNYPDTSTPLTAEFLLNYCHPIGEVFFTEDDNFNPNNEWGGIWELDTDGVVYGSKSKSSSSMFNTNTGTIIGEEKHTLTIQEMPSHSHGLRYYNNGREDIHTNYGSISPVPGSPYDIEVIKNTGGGQPHSIVQKTRICNIWRRIA